MISVVVILAPVGFAILAVLRAFILVRLGVRAIATVIAVTPNHPTDAEAGISTVVRFKDHHGTEHEVGVSTEVDAIGRK